MSQRFFVVAIVLLGSLCVSLSAAQDAIEPTTELLWADGAPGALGDEDKDKPTLIAYVVAKENATASGTAIVICPGGGYRGLAMDHEGHQIAQWLNSLGISAFICDYRHSGKGYKHPSPMLDVHRAIRTVRFRAEELGIQPNQIGVLGFSAGGHLASTALTTFNNGSPRSADPVERFSCRPDFGVLCYPVIAFGEKYTHRGSQNNLLGEDPPGEMIERLSSEKQVTKSCPPTFLWHTAEDKGVPFENSVAFFTALQAAGVPAELHVYEKGRHGVGLARDIPGTCNWPQECADWMRGRELIPMSEAKE